MVRWGDDDDALCIKLWQTKGNNISPKDLTAATVKKVHAKHFPDKVHTTFAPRHRFKARAFLAGKSLKGHRARSAKAKAKNEAARKEKNSGDGDGDDSDEDDSDEDYNTEDEEADDEDDDEEEDDEEEEDGESLGSDDTAEEDRDEEAEEGEVDQDCPGGNCKMPAKKKSTSKTPPRTKKAAKASAPGKEKKSTADSKLKSPPRVAKKASVEEVTEELNQKLAIDEAPIYSKEFSHPQINHSYPQAGVEHVTVDFCTPAYSKDWFNPSATDDQMKCMLLTKIPGYFLTEKRFRRGDRALAANSTKAESYKNSLNELEADNDFNQEHWSNAQLVDLPYMVDIQLVEWSIKCYPTKDQNITDLLGAPQCFGVLSVTMKSFEKRKQKTEGTEAVVDGSSDEEDQEMGGGDGGGNA